MAMTEMNYGESGGGGSLLQMFDDGLSDGSIPVVAGTFSGKNWDTDKAYSSVYIMLNADSSQDSYIKCGTRRGNNADAVFDSSVSGNNRIYRFDNVAQGTNVGTTQSTWAGSIIAFE